jgi:hypothetical protein
LVRDEMGGSASSTQYHDCLAGCLREIKTIACRERLQQLFVEQFRSASGHNDMNGVAALLVKMRSYPSGSMGRSVLALE